MIPGRFLPASSINIPTLSSCTHSSPPAVVRVVNASEVPRSPADVPPCAKATPSTAAVKLNATGSPPSGSCPSSREQPTNRAAHNISATAGIPIPRRHCLIVFFVIYICFRIILFVIPLYSLWLDLQPVVGILPSGIKSPGFRPPIGCY